MQLEDELVYINVNEDGEAYGFLSNLEAAKVLLERFPNDHIVVAYKDSYAHRSYLELEV